MSGKILWFLLLQRVHPHMHFEQSCHTEQLHTTTTFALQWPLATSQGNICCVAFRMNRFLTRIAVMGNIKDISRCFLVKAARDIVNSYINRTKSKVKYLCRVKPNIYKPIEIVSQLVMESYSHQVLCIKFPETKLLLQTLESWLCNQKGSQTA